MIDEKRLKDHLDNGKDEYILCSAIHLDDGKDYLYKPYNIDKGVVFCGLRHPCIFEQFTEFLGPRSERKYAGIVETQGFLTSKNRFLTRRESAILAKENGQVPKDSDINELYSEDLW